ncbi:TPA: hypothetical protein DDW35_06050, partial [Candidatus Sumerlaeota bacterium]|nr:hypothetical protein [Candidatus Sumerlaeota bacterium]
HTIARTLADGNGFTQSIRWHFSPDAPVVQSAAAERPPLFPALVGLIWKLGGRLATIDTLNLLLGSLGVLLLFLLYEKAIGTKLAFLAALLPALNPSIARTCVFPWTEALFLVLQSGALFLLIKMEYDKTQQSAETPLPATLPVLAGLLASAAYLARPNALALIAAASFLFLCRKQWRSLLLFLLPCMVALLPWFLYVWVQKGNPLYSVQGHHARVAYITDGMAAGWGANIPTAGEFFRTGHPLQLMARNAWDYLIEILSFNPLTPAGFQHLGLASLGLLGLWLLRKQPGALLLALCGALHFALIALTWSTHEGDRLTQPAIVCLAPLAVAGLYAAITWIVTVAKVAPSRESGFARQFGAVLTVLLIGTTLIFQIRYLYMQHQFIPRAYPARPLPPATFQAQFDAAIPADAIIATADPFSLNWSYNRPTLFFPDRLTTENAEQFFTQYHVSHLAVTPQQLNRIESLIQMGKITKMPYHLPDGLLWCKVQPQKQ